MLGVAALLWWLPVSAGAATYPLPAPGNDVIGEITRTTVEQGETLLDIAREHDLGYNEITAANPGLDPWLPPPGTEIVLPTRYVLPSAPREGIIVNLAEMRLYYYPSRAADGERMVMTFPIGIGQEGWSTPLGITEVIDKIKDPSWTVPDSIIAEYEREGVSLPKIMPPGPDNPLGRYALRLGKSRYLIHGTNKPFGVGRRISHGCIRMYPEDIEVLFNEVSAGIGVWIIQQPYKLGRAAGMLFLEAHTPISETDGPPVDNLSQTLSAISAVVRQHAVPEAQQVASRIVARERGMPEPVIEFEAASHTPRDGWVLQLGAFSNMDNAVRLAAEVEDYGAAVSVQARANDGYCHVLVGPYADEDMAMQALVKFKRLTGYHGDILPADRHGMLTDCVR